MTATPQRRRLMRTVRASPSQAAGLRPKDRRGRASAGVVGPMGASGELRRATVGPMRAEGELRRGPGACRLLAGRGQAAAGRLSAASAAGCRRSAPAPGHGASQHFGAGHGRAGPGRRSAGPSAPVAGGRLARSAGGGLHRRGLGCVQVADAGMAAYAISPRVRALGTGSRGPPAGGSSVWRAPPAPWRLPGRRAVARWACWGRACGCLAGTSLSFHLRLERVASPRAPSGRARSDRCRLQLPTCAATPSGVRSMVVVVEFWRRQWRDFPTWFP